MRSLTSPAFWASLGVILAAVGLELPNALWMHIAELVAAAAGVVGIVSAWLRRGTQQ